MTDKPTKQEARLVTDTDETCRVGSCPECGYTIPIKNPHGEVDSCESCGWYDEEKLEKLREERS
jgi:hypothetical protein